MKKIGLILVLILLIPSIGVAEFQNIPTDYSTGMLNMFDEEAEYYLMADTYEMVGLMAYEVGIDISTCFPDFAVAIDKSPFFGIAHQDNEVAMFFVFPLPKKQENSAQKYVVSYYNISTQTLYYDPEFVIGIGQVYNMMSSMCGNMYTELSSSDIAKGLDHLDQVLLYNWEEPRTPSLDFMKGKRPKDWSSYFTENSN